jgi:hypothetical protein
MCSSVESMVIKTNLLEEVVDDDDHSPPEVLPAQEVKPGCLVNLLLERLSDCLYLGVAAAVLGVRVRPEATKGRDSFLSAVFR